MYRETIWNVQIAADRWKKKMYLLLGVRANMLLTVFGEKQRNTV